jgi:hypothetical protein
MRRLPPPALLLLALLAAFLARPVAAQPPQPRAVFVVTEATIAGRLRVMGRPGDLALRNRAATAIVRKSDGWLVDFWLNSPGASTAAQLDGTSAIDGLWVLHPVVLAGTAGFNFTAQKVVSTEDSVEASALLSLGAGKVRIVTVYKLDADLPRLIISTRFEHVGGGTVSGLSLGDNVKWGNVDYIVEGKGRTPPTFTGEARWIGRRGAGGDLVLRTLEPKPMRLAYRMRHNGIAPAISAVYAARSIAPGGSVEVRRLLEYAPIDWAPKTVPTGTLEASVKDENGQPLAAKLSLRGLPPTPDPDFGNDGDESGAGRFVWSGTGEFSRALPPGRYRVLATAGIERDAAEWPVEIRAGQSVRVSGRLPRVITTPGWISGDLHLHQAASVDADISYRTRLVSVAAEGVELAVATDHFEITDLRPTLQELRLSGRLATPVLTMVGSEVSTVGNRFGHFGLMPMQPGKNVNYENTTPRQMFADMRRASPDGIIQVNHPRWDEIGYFQRYALDPKSTRVPPQHKAAFDPSYDAIEIYNGYDATSLPKIRQVLFDWMRLLGQGHRYTGTGNSDSHKLFYVDPGVPRNLIRWGDVKSDAEDFRASEAEIIRAIKAGRVVVTSGPVLDVEVDGKGPGETAAGGKVKRMRVRVRAAPWIDVSEVEILLGPNGSRLRYISVAPSREIVRLDTSFELRVAAPTFVVVFARGNRDLPNVYSAKIRPLAFSNPVWLEP